MRVRLPIRRWGRAAACWAVVVLCALEAFGAEPLDRSIAEQFDTYRAKLDELASWCESNGLPDRAAETLRWLEPKDPMRLYLPVLPTRVGSPPLPENTPGEVVEWDKRFRQLRTEQADSLFSLARRAIGDRRASLAFDLVMAAIHENPDHEASRRLLGYQQYQDEWHTLYEIRKLRSGQVWDDRFGWLPKDHLQRYVNGERFYKKRWISAEDDARLRRDIRSGWVIESEHYTVRTNHGPESAARLSVKLEHLYRVWKQLFIRYYATEAQVASLFEGPGRGRRIELPRHRVVYFRDRDDYNRSLRPAFPNIEQSIGVYVESTRRAYFFAGEEADDRTLYHEATHQLFHESRPVAPSVGRDRNFWIIEGIAVYMESLRREGDYYVLGGFDDLRMVAARYRFLHDGFYVPLGELTTYGMKTIQSHPKVATLYSQMAGLTHFLIHGEEGRYRDALVAYLARVYAGRDTPTTLSRLTGKSYAELDRQYRAFMEQKGPEPSQ